MYEQIIKISIRLCFCGSVAYISWAVITLRETWVLTKSAILGDCTLAMVGGNTVAALLLIPVEETTLTSMCSRYMVLAIKSAC